MRGLPLVLGLALASVAGAAVSQAVPPSSPPEPSPAPAPMMGPFPITVPQWTRIPDSRDMERYYPERAERVGLGGRAVIRCMVLANGRLARCQVISETPPGEGFGAAAVRLARLFQMKPRVEDGKPIYGGMVQVPINFSPPY